ncbi:unnamed protein product [Rhizoctonia solani]|uniref:Iminophenyl-pyruvate dimer synthase domain-containing protein n=1 Tax=Rhizoctonia solani TaxID=456999 RepID=A0A8H3BMZ4_9AGAM|nr:unnamed protein product [Rhizoctonia solani]
MSKYTFTGQAVFSNPTEPPDVWTLDALRQHCQTAMILETCTIPLYLYAMYSIDTSAGSDEQAAAKAIRGIVKQEMLHMALAGNLLAALRGRPQLYGEVYAPKYPSELLYEGVLMTLAPAHPSQIQNFVEIEQPVDDKVGEDSEIAAVKLLAQYESIGQFYESLKNLHDRPEIGDDIFDKESEKRQWTGDDFFDGQLAAITDLKTAEAKLDLIIQQGEGGPPPQGSPSVLTTPSHYEIFKDLSTKHLKVHKLIANPTTRQFEGKEKLYSAMLAFDAAYSYLLWTIELVWTYGGPDEDKKQSLKNNVSPLMSDMMSPIARFLVRQDLKTVKNKRAGPPFNLYIFSTRTSPKAELKKIAEQAAEDYPNDLQGIPGVVEDLFDIGNI